MEGLVETGILALSEEGLLELLAMQDVVGVADHQLLVTVVLHVLPG